MFEKEVDVRHLYENGKLFKPSYLYGIRYYKSELEIASEMVIKRQEAIKKARKWTVKNYRHATVFLRRSGRVVEKYIFRNGKPVKLPFM